MRVVSFFVVPHTFHQDKRRDDVYMGFWELLVLAVGLSMDAFAVAVCKGLSLRSLRPRHMAVVGAWFGAFQALMPAAGWLLGAAFAHRIAAIDHWIAFVLLSLIGGNMIREALSREEEDCDPSLAPAAMLLLAVATSIDALAVGVTFAFLQVSILPAVGLIGCTTFVLSLAGVWIGHRFGSRLKSRATLAGGVILCLIGLKILLEHLGYLG